MKHSMILLAATCVLILMDKSQGQTTSSPPPVTGSTEGFSGCPSFLTYGGGTQKYRFVEDINNLPPPQYLPCSGDIDSCVYTAHTNYYCMNGNKPDYTPQQLNPQWDRVTLQNVSTFAGIFNEIFGVNNFTTNEGGYQPLVSIKLFPNVFARRLVLGGFILKTVKNNFPYENTIYRVGFTDPNEFAGPTYIYLPIGESITEAFGRSGSFIDQVTFGVTRNFVNPDAPPKFYSVGGANGGALFDATPPPNLNGHCTLVGLSGQTAGDAQEVMFIQGIEFHWSCVGKPQKY